MGIALFVIGDEILSGKRQDKHVAKVRELLAARGLELAEVRFLPDDEARIAEAVLAASARGDVVLSCGGIGATPDDRTRQAVARAFGLPVVRHAEAASLIAAQHGGTASANRLLMADFAEGALLIPNPINRVAGFSLDQIYCVPGFPEMAWPMLEWVLDGPLRELHRAEPPVEFRLRALGSAAESDLLELMEAMLHDFPGSSLSSLPFRGDEQRPRHIEFGIKGPREIAAPAFVWFRDQLLLRPELTVEDIAVP